MMLSTGDVLGPYRITTVLGSRLGLEVYRAQQASLEREVVLKLAPVIAALPYAAVVLLLAAAAVAVRVLLRPAPPRQKRVAVAALALIVVAGAGWGGWRAYSAAQPPKAVIIVVAEFEGQKATRGVDWGRRIYLQVRDQVTKAGLSDRVDVRRVYDSYGSSEAARAAGEAQKATLVLWGWYDDLGVSPHFELMRTAEEYGGALVAPPIDLVDFDLYAKTGPQEMGYIVGVVLGLVHYSDGDYAGAVDLFSTAIANAPEVSALEGQEVGYFYRGVARLSAHEPVAEAVADLQEAVRRRPDMYQAHWGLAIAYTGYCTPTLALDAALAEAQTCAGLRPQESKAQWLIGQVRGERQEWAQAADAYREAARLDPENADAYAGLARALEAMGQPEEAEAARAQALDLRREEIRAKPEDPAEAQDDLGTAYFDLGRYEEAAAAFQAALRLRPDSTRYQRHLGMAYYWQDRVTEGGSPEALDAAVAAYEAVVQKDPYDALAYSQLAGIYRELGRPEDALEAYEAAVRIEPCDADTLLLLGNQYSDMGRDDDAERVFRQLTELKPSMAFPWHYVATAAYLRGDFEAAEAGYRAAVAAAPEDADLRYGLASALYALGRYREAGEAYGRAAELAPDDAASLVGLGDALAQQGRTEEAVDAYKRALELAPEAVTWVSLGLQYEVLADWEAAEAAYAEAAVLAPDDAMVRGAHARALWQLNRLPEALAEYEAAAALAPGVEDYPEALTLGYAALELPDKAAAAAEATLAINPRNATAHLILGGIAEDRGERDKAVEEYRLALDCAGSNAGLAELAQQGLDRLQPASQQ